MLGLSDWRRFWFAGSVVVLVLGITLFASASVHGQAAAPDAPSEFTFFGGVWHWVDNSDDEDGFRIVASFSGDSPHTYAYVIGSNITSLVIPPEAATQCPDRFGVSYQLRAFRGDTDSAAAGTGVIVECEPAAAARPSLTLPSTGTNDTDARAMTLAAMLTVMLGAGAIAAGVRAGRAYGTRYGGPRS